ncbi:MAG TPA: undecaprenyl/decaprenyl-phosphate alpha-N-acetylglucosaminyl 1-phosphate transferase [Firmicutes bacterium]|nr:undecaprenyl/decaprenyl-phosphate alpha-N-acetylglucosaminyl 1-phosphate transferase [Bacillota bacterium]
MEKYVWAFVEAAMISLVVTPVARLAAVKFGFVDRPSERRVHDHVIPLLGGLAIMIAFYLTSLSWLPLDRTMVGLIAAGMFIFVVGLLDDYRKSRRELPAKVKLAGQVIASIIAVLFGIKIKFVTNPLGGMIYLGMFSIPVTIIWMVSITNVVNLMDGLDGLAAGVSAIAAFALFVVAAGKGQEMSAMTAIALAGATVGFLRYNFNPAKIFMGDAGAMFIGFLLAAVSTVGALKGATTVALTIPFLALGIPIFDTAFAIVRRVREGKPIYIADKGHIHHRLLAMGLSQRQAVITLYSLASLLGLSAVLSAQLGTLPAYLVIVVVALILFVLFREFVFVKEPGGYRGYRRGPGERHNAG